MYGITEKDTKKKKLCPQIGIINMITNNSSENKGYTIISNDQLIQLF